MKDKIEAPNIIKMLIVVGGFLVLLSGLLAVLGFPIGFTFIDTHLMMIVLPNVSIYHGIVEATSGIIILLIGFFVNMKNLGSVQNSSIATLVFSITSLIGGGGFLAGFTLVFIGSIFGISYSYVISSRPSYPEHRETAIKTNVKSEKVVPAKNVSKLLKPEERELYNLIEKADGAIFQAELVEKSGFTKVKITRILDRLEGRGIIERRRRGMTNIVILKNNEKASPQSS